MRLSRSSVVAIHLALSALILGGLLLIMARFWYPYGLFSVAGGWQGLKILAPIDLVLGPLLTLMFYRAGKAGAVRDLAMIAVVQLAALSYGMHAVYSQRPVALVFAEGAFIAATAEELAEANATLRTKGYEPIDPDSLSTSRPPVVVARPIPREEYGRYVTSLFNDMPELAFRSDRFEPVSQHLDILSQAALAPDDPPADKTETWFSLKTKYGKGVLNLDLDSARVITSRREPTGAPPATQALRTPADSRDTDHTPGTK